MIKSLMCACVALMGVLVADEVPPVLEIGKPAPDFSLPGTDGKQYSLADFKDAKVLVVMFTAAHCPDARAAAPRMAELDAKYRDQGVAFVAISCNDPLALRPDELGYGVYGDSQEEMKPFADENGWKFPYLYDGDTQKATSAYGAQATPHVFVFDAARILRYNGRIDDMKRQFGPLPEDNYVGAAIDALLAGKEVETKTTRAFGCSTKWNFKRESVAKDQERWEALPVTVEFLDAAGAKALAANPTEKLRVVNFWSTTCGPCVAEFPMLVETYRRFQNRPVELITISLDPDTELKQVQRFLQSRHAAVAPRTLKTVEAEGRKSNNYLYKGNPDDLAEAFDPTWTGALPLTLVIEPGGKVAWKDGDALEAAELRGAIVKWLDAATR